MPIEVVNPEIIGLENYTPTEIDNLFINTDTGEAVIIGYYTAYRFTQAG